MRKVGNHKAALGIGEKARYYKLLHTSLCYKGFISVVCNRPLTADSLHHGKS